MLSSSSLPLLLLVAATVAQALTGLPASQDPIGNGNGGRDGSRQDAVPCGNTPGLHVTFPGTLPLGEQIRPAPTEPKSRPHSRPQASHPERPKEHLKRKRQSPNWFNPCKSPAALATPGLTCEGGEYTVTDSDNTGYYQDTQEDDFQEWQWGPWQDGEENRKEKVRYGSYGWTQRCHRTRWSRWQCWYDYGGYTSYSWYE